MGLRAQDYYARVDIQRAILDAARSREVAGAFETGAFGRRPNVLIYPNDLTSLVKEGCVEFHISVEHWISPMSIANGNEEIYKELRSGWDFIIDIDGKKFEYSKIAARLIIQLLERYGIRSIGVKFSGRRGFHICIPWKAFPKHINKQETKKLYPELPRILARYIREEIKDELLEKLIALEGLNALVGENVPESIDPFEYVEVEKDWGSRHMFRAPYSLHKSTMLVAMPIRQQEIEDFDPSYADPSRIKEIVPFVVDCNENEAEFLVIEALDWYSQFKKAEEKKEEKPRGEIRQSTRRIGIEHFPPSIQKISEGMQDGKKRALFILLSFLTNCNWKWEEIEEYIKQWNERNPVKLPVNYVQSQMRWFERQSKKILPPNYESGVYQSLGIASEEELSGKYKSPLVYAFKLSKPKKEYKPKTKRKPRKKKEKEHMPAYEDMSG